MKKICLTLLFALLAFAPRPGAAEIMVNASGDVKMPGDGKCTLREAVQTAFDYSNGSSLFYPECATGSGQDEIQFAAGVGTIELLPANGEINISSDLTIAGPATISGANQTRIFRISTEIFVQLFDLTLTQAVWGGSGAALLVQGGAAIVEIDGCKFTQNTSSIGGAIAFHGWELTVRKSVFSQNYSTYHGGAIGGGGNWDIQDSFFENNTAETGGGALDCDGGGQLKILRSAFSMNQAFGLPEISDNYTSGGGAVMSGCETNIIHSLFEMNMALGQVGGGGLYLTSAGKGQVVETVFVGNSAGWGIKQFGSGGGIHAKGDLIVHRSAFEQNSAKGGFGGGAIFFHNSESEVVNSVLQGNYSKKDETMTPKMPEITPGDGGAIAAVGDTQLRILNSSLAYNYGTNELFFFSGTGDVTLKNTLIGAWKADATCGGDVALIFNGDDQETDCNPADKKDGCNAQSKQGATCQGIPETLDDGGILLKTFNATIPGSTPLTFAYVNPKFMPQGAGKGDSSTCKNAPVGGVDILGNLRIDTCTIGAVEKPF